MRAAFALLTLVVAALAVGCGGSSKAPQASAGTPPQSTSNGRCAPASLPVPPNPKILRPPGRLLDPHTRYTLVFDTSCGTFDVRLDQKTAPHADASLVALARKGYFDDTIFHAIVPGVSILGGDPTQTGAGQPGYSTIDRPSRSAKYVRGTFAMAKTAFDAPGTAGSVFFIVTAPVTKIKPVYAIAGKVTRGIDVVEHIGRLGTKGGIPTRTIVVRHVTVDESPARG